MHVNRKFDAPFFFPVSRVTCCADHWRVVCVTDPHRLVSQISPGKGCRWPAGPMDAEGLRAITDEDGMTWVLQEATCRS